MFCGRESSGVLTCVDHDRYMEARERAPHRRGHPIEEWPFLMCHYYYYYYRLSTTRNLFFLFLHRQQTLHWPGVQAESVFVTRILGCPKVLVQRPSNSRQNGVFFFVPSKGSSFHCVSLVSGCVFYLRKGGGETRNTGIECIEKRQDGLTSKRREGPSLRARVCHDGMCPGGRAANTF